MEKKYADRMEQLLDEMKEKYVNTDELVWSVGVFRDEICELVQVYNSVMNRHTTYTNALNKDIADKAAKIELMEKEIEGRKEGYVALKTQIDNVKKELEDTKKESEKWQDLAKMNRDTICNQYDVCEEFKNKITELEKELADCKEKIKHQKENLNALNKTLEIRTKEKESLVEVRNNQEKEIEAHESENARLTERIKELKAERDKQMARVNDLCMELDCVKASKEKHEEAARDKTIEDAMESINYWRTQCLAAEEARDAFMKENSYLKKELEKTCTCKELDLKGHQMRETALVNDLADKNDEIKSLKEENSYLKSEIKQKQDIIKKAYDRYSDEVIKTRKDVLEVAYRGIEKDNGYVGFKLYVKNALAEAEGDKNEANEIITEAVRSAYAEWDKTQKEEKEKTVKYKPSEIDRFIDFLKDEVDKKHIVDISKGVETELGISRELLDAAIKALVDDGYHEYYGGIPQATDATKYDLVHVLTIPSVAIRDIINLENIKSLDFKIPCGSDSIE